jgi:hypothetical protein
MSKKNPDHLRLVRSRPPVPIPHAGDVWEIDTPDEEGGLQEFVVLSVRGHRNREWHALGYGPEMRLVEMGPHHIDLGQRYEQPHPRGWVWGKAEVVDVMSDGKERLVNMQMWHDPSLMETASEDDEDDAPAKPKRRSRSSG